MLELLVAIAVTSALFVLLASLLSVSLNQWSRQTSRQENAVEGTAALDTLKADLRSIVSKNDGTEWLHLRQETVKSLGVVPHLLFYSRPTDSAQVEEGDVRIVSYRISLRPVFAGRDPIHALYRETIPPEKTLSFLGEKDLYTDAWQSWRNQPPESDTLITSHVGHWEIDLVFRLPDGSTKIIANPTSFRISTDFELTGPNASTIPQGSILERIDLRLTVIDEGAQNMLNAGTHALEEILLRYGYTYSASVTIPPPAF